MYILREGYLPLMKRIIDGVVSGVEALGIPTWFLEDNNGI
jgi:hypothetical protein